MAKRLLRSFEERHIEQINLTYNILTTSIKTSFKDAVFLRNDIFRLKSQDEIDEMKTAEIQETERYTVFDILSAIEAMFIIDYYSRCEKRLKDDVAKDFRKISRRITNRVDFQEDILKTWAKHNPGNRLLNELNSIFLYRHWIAHGRYWRLKVNASKYDFNYLYAIALQIKESFGLLE
jgi:hypothetical protein